MRKKCVYVATHKAFNYKVPSCYKIMQVGAAINKSLSYDGDNTGDNISNKNKNFCELTLLYWIWKNSKVDIVGLVHYRRYFFARNKKEILSGEEIDSILKDSDVIVPEKKYIHFSNIEKQYANYHNVEDYIKCRQCIEELFPEYIKEFDMVSKAKSFYCYNMLICNKEILDQYCNWLFKILFALEKRVNLENYDDYNKRLFGFLSERLFNVWILHNDLTVKEIPVYNVEEKISKQKIKQFIHKLLWWM